jgi:DNA-binding transcriptional ArsR family regulator
LQAGSRRFESAPLHRTYQSQVSGHLAVLRRAGLVEAERRGYFNIYRVDSRALDLVADRLHDLASRSK